MSAPSATVDVRDSRFLNRRAAILLLAALLVAGGIWYALSPRNLSPQERQLLGTWQVNVTSQLGVTPPYTQIWEFKPDRTCTIAQPNRSAPGTYTVNIIQRWSVQSDSLLLEPHTPRLSDRFHLWRDQIESALRRQKASRSSRYTIKSATAEQCELLIEQTRTPVSYLKHVFTRLPESASEPE